MALTDRKHAALCKNTDELWAAIWQRNHEQLLAAPHNKTALRYYAQLPAFDLGDSYLAALRRHHLGCQFRNASQAVQRWSWQCLFTKQDYGLALKRFCRCHGVARDALPDNVMEELSLAYVRAEDDNAKIDNQLPLNAARFGSMVTANMTWMRVDRGVARRQLSFTLLVSTCFNVAIAERRYEAALNAKRRARALLDSVVNGKRPNRSQQPGAPKRKREAQASVQQSEVD